jgi:hypothetical protein
LIVMLRAVFLATVLGVAGIAAAAADERPVTGEEFEALLIGCWVAMSDPHDSMAGGACFREMGVVETWQAGYEAFWYEGGRYQLKDDRLILRGEPIEGWIFTQPEVVCDATIMPRMKLWLKDCIGRGAYSGGLPPDSYRPTQWTFHAVIEQ